MLQAKEKNDELFKRYIDFCNKLNLDQKTITDSWEIFESVHKNFTLEGDILNWIGCSLFGSCWGTETPTVSQSGVVKGNCLNLTTLLRYSNLSFAKFFSIIPRWSEMTHMPDDFQNKVKHLKDTFNVTCNTFKEFHPLFEKVFLKPDPQDLEQSKHRHRKQKTVQCTSAKLLEFVWVLYITLKGDDPQYSTELVKSFHLLYACLDLAFKNAYISSERRELINSTLEVLDNNPVEPPCLIQFLCKSPSMLTDAMHMKMYTCRDAVANLIKNGVLNGDQQTLTSLLDSGNFEMNYKNIMRLYDAQLLNKGDFDEKIFLAEYRRILLEREQTQQFSDSRVLPFSEQESPRNIALPSRRSTAAASSPGGDRLIHDLITIVHVLVPSRSREPSQKLLQLFETCTVNPTERIKEIVTRLSEMFVQAYPNNNCPNMEEVNMQLELGVILFYKFIENILQNEKDIRDDISALVQQDVFYECMFACCLEIVIFSYGNLRKFPWILKTLKVQPYQFVKMIELIVRSKEPLSKQIIKHLNRVEETCLETLIWESDSQLWQVIASKTPPQKPRFQDIALPGQLMYCDPTATPNNNNVVGDGSTISSTATSTTSKIINNITINSLLESPGPSATDCFQSPITHGTVNRQLFSNDASVQAGQSVLQKPGALKTEEDKPKSTATPPEKPKRGGSLAIILRKFYNLAGVRMNNLCSKLNITQMCKNNDINEQELKSKIWTLFECSICDTDLIKDRHLDQLLMSAVYVISILSKLGWDFIYIMKNYKSQPHAKSDIYRSVFMSQEPGKPAQRDDLIDFYNYIYIVQMQKFVKKFVGQNSEQANILYSPLPRGKRALASPNVQIMENVFVKPLESPSSCLGPSINYTVSRSPSKDLKDMNRAVNSNGVTSKRLLTDADMDIPASKRVSNRKMKALVEERRSQNTE